MKDAANGRATYREFVDRYPDIGRAWDLLDAAGRQGPLDARAVALVRLAIAVGAVREVAVRADVRKALVAGATRAEVEQVVALAARLLGRSNTVAVHTWVQAELTAAAREPDPMR